MNIEVHDDARCWACVLMLGIVAVVCIALGLAIGGVIL